MECAGWTFRASGARIGRPCGGAGQEALVIGTSTSGCGRALRPWRVGPAAARDPAGAGWRPDFERFPAVHFTKVGDQTLLALDTWIDSGRAQGQPTADLVRLRDALRAARGLQPAS